MFWLTRPPYLRWVAAFLIVVVGVVVEFRGEPTVRHPFAADAIALGETVDESRVRWADVPVGLLPPVELPIVAHRPIAAGEPVPPGNETGKPTIPPGWWGVEVDLPSGARTGMRVRLVIPGAATEGRIVDVRDGDFGERSGLVAVPAEAADMVATAVVDATIAVMVGG